MWVVFLFFLSLNNYSERKIYISIRRRYALCMHQSGAERKKSGKNNFEHYASRRRIPKEIMCSFSVVCFVVHVSETTLQGYNNVEKSSVATGCFWQRVCPSIRGENNCTVGGWPELDTSTSWANKYRQPCSTCKMQDTSTRYWYVWNNLY